MRRYRRTGVALRGAMAGWMLTGAAAGAAQESVPAGPAATEVLRLETERKALDARIATARLAAAREAEARAVIARFEAMRPAAEAARALLTPAPAPAAATASSAAALTPDAAARLAEAVTAAQEANGRQKFGGIEFGVGISLTMDIGTNDRISEAVLANGVVRVTDSDNSRARIMLESHYFFKNRSDWLGLPAGDVGFGPFVALQPGTDNLIEAVALGGMIGFRKGEKSESFNIGIGLVIDPDTRILGDGIVANRALPAGETEIRYKEEPQAGILVLASFAF